jgi:hypothetical protein
MVVATIVGLAAGLLVWWTMRVGQALPKDVA